jgi:UDP-N-acetylenolpyruvoylglucosamine reductase
MTNIIEFLETERIPYTKNVDLKSKTWIKRGGIAKIWVQPLKLSEFEILISWCQLNKIKFEVVGNTSNCYFLNDYNPDLVISTLKINKMHIEAGEIICDCGVNMNKLSKYCISHGIANYEGFIGLPGTAGGAAINNSGSYGSLISKVVKNVTILNNGRKILLTNEQIKYSHRNSALKSKEINGVVISVTFDILQKEDPNVLEKRAKEFQIHRRTVQEQNFPNLGTTFCTLEFKKLSFIRKCINAFAKRLLNRIPINPIKRGKLKTNLFLKLHGAGKFREYVSGCHVACFTWKDIEADLNFNDYIDFINKNTTKAVIEIDIKRDK